MIKAEIRCDSEYIAMRDGVRLAVSTWLPHEWKGKLDRYIGVVTNTRYWRAKELQQDNPEYQIYYSFACYLLSRGYVLVAADVRGSGASFGVRETETSPAEVEDICDVIDWVARQEWCDGRVATEGTSYTANTTLFSLATGSSALQFGVCRAPDFDICRHLFAPGGIANHWFIETWGGSNQAQDNNDVATLFGEGYWPSRKGSENVLGVRPVDADKDLSLLNSAVAEHKNNFSVRGKSEAFLFVDSKPLGSHCFIFEPDYQHRVEKASIPVVIRCGWHDAGTALGALSMFASFSNPIRVILGPWNHGGDFRADPLIEGDGTKPEGINQETVFGLTVQSLDEVFKTGTPMNDKIKDRFGRVEYYTLGENRWKTSDQWPLPFTEVQRLYLAPDHQLSATAPPLEEGCDLYRVDPTTGTGLNNRWHTQMGKPIFFPDRQEADKKLLVYDTPPLERDTEITGHPVVYLYLRSSATDGQFFVYLETVDPDGRVRMLTEGQLRGLHRKISDQTPPYRMFGSYHSLKKKDAQPLIPGEVAEISFDLFPLSVLLKKGQRIRLAIAGADSDVFQPIAGCESPDIKIERNAIYASCIDLPMIK